MNEKEIDIELKQVVESIKKLINYADSYFSEGISITLKDYKERILLTIKSDYLKKTVKSEITIERLREYIKSKSQYKIKNYCVLYSRNYYENFLHERFPYETVDAKETDEGYYIYKHKDEKFNIEYEISPISNEYLILLLLYLIPRIDEFSFYQAVNFLGPFLDVKTYENSDKIDPLEIFRINQYSIKIKTQKDTDFEILSGLASSYCYNFTFFRNIPIIPVRNFDNLYKESIDFFRYEEMDIPRKIYNEELTYYYQMACSSRNPFMLYLLFYQIIEYFYAKVYDEEKVNFVKNRITDPDFNFNKEKNIRQFLNDLGAKFRLRENRLEEDEVLKLTLKKYVDLRNLKNKIEEYNESIIDYYQKNVASFTLEPSIDQNLRFINFGTKEEEHIYGNLMRRIYSIRNSLVHSKDISEARFKPFENEEELILELPLVRLVAEEIIHNSAKDIRI